MRHFRSTIIAAVLIATLVLTANAQDYTVKTGDMLWKIARDNGTTVEAVVEANDIDDPNKIYAGDVLTVPTKSEMNLTVNWEVGGFTQAESVLYVPNHEWLYVSNVNDQGLGYISRVSLDGVVDKEKFTDGIPIALGMAYYEDEIYIASLNSVKVIDINTGELIRELVAAEGGMMNDITITPDGRLYVTDSNTQTIFTSDGTGLIKWYQSDEFVMLNGILYHEGNLIVSNMDMATGTGEIVKIDVATKTKTVMPSSKEIGAVDGIALFGDKYLVSDASARELVLMDDTSAVSIGKLEGGMADINVNQETGEIYAPYLNDNKLGSYSYKGSPEQVTMPKIKETLSFYYDFSSDGKGGMGSDTKSFVSSSVEYPMGIGAMEGNVEAGLMLTAILRDEKGSVIGYGTELEDYTAMRNGENYWDTDWIVTIPGRGTLHGYQMESMPADQGVIFGTIGAGDVWTGDLTSKMAAGPHEGGYGYIVGGTGEFEGAQGRFAEFVRITMMGPAGELESVLEMRFELTE